MWAEKLKFLISLMFLTILSGCGLKGPLYQNQEQAPKQAENIATPAVQPQEQQVK